MVQAPRIFQLFQPLHCDEEYAATGIGLSIWKRFSSFMGGASGSSPSLAGARRSASRVCITCGDRDSGSPPVRQE